MRELVLGAIVATVLAVVAGVLLDTLQQPSAAQSVALETVHLEDR